MSEVSSPLQVPQPYELIEFFEASPSLEEPANGLWCYEVAAPGAATVNFCFNVLERWLKTQIIVQGEIVEEVVHEGATLLSISQRPHGKVLVGECDLGEGKTRLEIELQPHLSVRWNILADPVI